MVLPASSGCFVKGRGGMLGTNGSVCETCCSFFALGGWSCCFYFCPFSFVHLSCGSDVKTFPLADILPNLQSPVPAHMSCIAVFAYLQIWLYQPRRSSPPIVSVAFAIAAGSRVFRLASLHWKFIVSSFISSVFVRHFLFWELHVSVFKCAFKELFCETHWLVSKSLFGMTCLV